MYSIPMALYDYIPVAFYLIGSIVLAKYLKEKISKINWLFFIIGFSMVSIAGFLKASYKLIYALTDGSLNFMFLSNQFFTNQSFGFLIAGISLVTTLFKKNRSYAILPTMALVGLQVLGLSLVNASLIVYAKRQKNTKAIILFILSFVFILCMGYLATKEFDNSLLNWIAQFVNTFGQGLYYFGAVSLRKHK